METSAECPLCRSAASEIFSFDVAAAVASDVPGGYRASLSRCPTCSFLFVADPVWLEGSFSSELNRLDVGSVDRSLLVASFVRGLLGRRSRRSSWSVLDVGGGDGLLTRVLRDHGIDCRWTDPYCEPAYYVGPPADGVARFDLAVMGEVALHLTNPIESFREALSRSDRLMFTAVVPPEKVTVDWWYLMPSTGQHVAFYPTTAIAEIARRLGADWCSDGKFFHLLSTTGISRALRRRVEHRELSLLAAELYDVLGLLDRARGRQRSLTTKDQAAVEAAVHDKLKGTDD
ncbi:MAG: methyltransferase domain-containing protein [Actinobacteria bacterium]|nr:methyltransferase domain-containing protein [Actinomycetota bacterium]